MGKAETQDNIITPTGHVRTWNGHDAVVSAAWIAKGLSTCATNSTSPFDRRSR
jgi:hypothetical protein